MVVKNGESNVRFHLIRLSTYTHAHGTPLHHLPWRTFELWVDIFGHEAVCIDKTALPPLSWRLFERHVPEGQPFQQRTFEPVNITLWID